MGSRTIRHGICLAVLLLGAPAAAKPKIAWKEVQIVDKEPTTCKFVDDLDAESWRLVPFQSNKSLKERSKKKLQKQAAKAGANTIWITAKDTTALNSSSEAKAYLCTTADGTP